MSSRLSSSSEYDDSIGDVSAKLEHWIEHSQVGLVTVTTTSGDLLVLLASGEDSLQRYSLVKAKVGCYSTSNKGKQRIQLTKIFLANPLVI